MAAVMDRLSTAATAGISPWINLPAVIQGWMQWDEDVIFEYFGIDPFNNREWLFYTPYPHYYVQQWSKKLASVCGEDKCKLAMVPIQGEYKSMVPMDRGTLQYRSLWSCTNDTDTYFSVVIAQEQARAATTMSAWVDQWSYITTVGSKHQVRGPKQTLSSNEFVFSLLDNTQTNGPEIRAWVEGTSYVHTEDKFRGMQVSDLV